MPRRELKHPHQVVEWLREWGRQLREPAAMTLIDSAGLLWHIARIGRDDPLPENSMDADPVTESEAIAEFAYDALIGSDFEHRHGWHINLMPRMVLDALPAGWKDRALGETYGQLRLVMPAPADLLAPKLARNEPRDQQHAALARKVGLI
jgi:hypothetical protein